jgi:hypothetical protein
MTSPIDYNQHLLAYVQAWRQLLDASAAMTSALPFPPTPPGMLPAPPMPFVPPMAPPGTNPPGASPSTDYAQQLFGYLQAWRQYLEQAIGAAPAQGAPSTTQPTAGQPTGSQWTGSQSTGSQSSGSQSSSSMKAPVVNLPPRDDYGAIVADRFASGVHEMPPSEPDTRFVSADRASGSAFAGKTTPGASASSAQAEPRSLFSRRAADTPSATVTQTGRDPRRAAPPATSKWWEAGQGLRPGFKDKPSAKNILNVPPVQDFGSR